MSHRQTLADTKQNLLWHHWTTGKDDNNTFPSVATILCFSYAPKKDAKLYQDF